MTAFNCIFQYLSIEGIEIDKSEFLFQLQSHPDYPNLLAVVDTLNFFDIPAGAFRITPAEYDQLPSHFVTFLDLGAGSELYFVEKKESNYNYYKGKKKVAISRQELSEKTNGVFLLIENENKERSKKSGKYLKWILLVLLIFMVVFQVVSKSKGFLNPLFLLFSGTGIFLSIAALKDVFGIKSSFVDNLCNANSATGCTSVINSKKWKIFEFISFSDLSLLFFSTQFLSQLVFVVTGNEEQFFAIQKLLLFLSIPFMILSVYYQKFVEKKWCTICLSIISVLLLELFYLSLFYKDWMIPAAESLVLLGIIFFTILVIWQWVKKLLLKQKKLQEFFIKGKRFSRNYEIFKNTLITGKQVIYPDPVFEIGNKESRKSILISTNPFCGYCKDAHFLIEKISKKHTDDLSVKLILNVDLTAIEDEYKKDFCKRLASIYLAHNPQKFSEALHDWFERKDVKSWNEKYAGVTIAENAEEVLKTHHFWAINNKFQFTPAIFIDNYPFPRNFDRENLPLFMEEVLEDDNW